MQAQAAYLMMRLGRVHATFSSADLDGSSHSNDEAALLVNRPDRIPAACRLRVASIGCVTNVGLYVLGGGRRVPTRTDALRSASVSCVLRHNIQQQWPLEAD